MPSISGIDFSDGISIALGLGDLGIKYPKSQMISDFRNKTIAQCEDVANIWLAGQFNQRHISDQIRVHIFSLDPLKYTVIVANVGVVIPDNWWG